MRSQLNARSLGRTHTTMPMPRRSREPVVIYSAWLVIILVASFVFVYTAFRVYASLPYALQRAPWIGFLLNVIVPLLAGVISGAVAIYVLSRRGLLEATVREHLFRAAPWYLLSCLLVLIVVRNEGIKDFGLWSQVITWPLYSTVGALIADIVLSWRSSRIRVSRAIGA